LDSNRALARQACQGAPVHVQIARERPVMALLFPSGRIELRDARSLKPLRTFNVQQSANEYSRTYRIGLSSDGKLLAAFDDKLGLRLWNVAEGRHERVALEPNGSSTVDFSPDARWVLVGQNLGNLKLFAVSNLWKVYEAGSDVHITAFTPDGRYLFHDGVKGGLVRVDLKTFNADGPQGSTRLWGLEASRDSKRMAVTLPGSLLWTGGRGEVWQTEPLRLLSNIKFGDMPMPEVSLSPDGDRVAYGGSDGRLMVFRSSTGATLANLKGHRKDVDGVRFLTKDRLLSWSGQTVHIWNLARIQ
jgi:WD40 repeat protein